MKMLTSQFHLLDTTSNNCWNNALLRVHTLLQVGTEKTWNATH